MWGFIFLLMSMCRRRGNTLYISDINTLNIKRAYEDISKGRRTMEECPKCKKWTLFYDPRKETMNCANCNYQQSVKYEAFVKEKNIIDLLLYPTLKESKLTRIEA